MASRIRLSCAAVLLWQAMGIAQETPPSAEAVLEQMEQARRGQAAPELLELMKMEGRFSLVVGRPSQEDMQLAGPFTLFYAPGRAVQVMDYPGWGTMRSGYDERFSWEDHPAFGASTYSGADDAAMRRCLDVFRYTPWRRMYESAALRESKTLDGRPHHLLAMTPKEGEPDLWYVDPQTSLPRRVDLVLPGDEGVAQLDFEDWKLVDGVPYAHTVKTTVGSATGVSTFTKITHGADVPDAEFAPTEKVLALMNQNEPKIEDCRIEKVQRTPVASIRKKIKMQDIGRELAHMLPAVMQHLNSVNVAPAGAPFTRYYGDVRQPLVEVEAGIPVTEAIKGKDEVHPGELPAGRVATTWHIGPYHELSKSYARLEAWMKQQQLEPDGAPWEIYWTDPGLEQDPAKWRTQILWPVK